MTLSGNGQMTLAEAYGFVRSALWEAIHISKIPPVIRYQRWNKTKRTIEFSYDGQDWFRITVERIK